jgi:hypothetical protein
MLSLPWQLPSDSGACLHRSHGVTDDTPSINQALHWRESSRPCCRSVPLIQLRRPPTSENRSENLYRPLVPHPVKILCYAAISDLFKYLPISKTSPGALDVRQKLQLASWMSLWPLKLEKYRCGPSSWIFSLIEINAAARWDSRTRLGIN